MLKTLIMKKLLLLITICISSISYAQDNQVNGKGLRNGEWIIMYKDNFVYYDYMSKLLNLDEMLVNDRETNSEEEAKYFEKVRYKKGIKQGEFQVFSANVDKSDKYPLIAMGEYKDGQITGNLIMVGYENNTQIRLCYAQYENGKIKDQDIVLEEKANYGSVNYGVFGSKYVRVYPVIKMRNGVCIEETITKIDNASLFRILKTDKGFTRFMHRKNELEVAELDSNFKYQGITSLYEETQVPFDTTKLGYRGTYINGKINGTAYWYDTKTGNVQTEMNYIDGVLNGPATFQKRIYWRGGNAAFSLECNYVDGLLNGVAKLKTKSGQTYVEANYKDGLLNGKYITMYLNDGSNIIAKGPFCEQKINKRLYSVVDENQDNRDRFEKTIPMFKKEGHTTLADGVFKFYEANYVNGKIDGKYNYFYSNGKKLYEGTVTDCKEVDWKVFDTNGKVIFDKKEDNLRREEKQKKEEEYFNTAVINCAYCNNPVKLREAVISGGGCHCFKENGEGIEIWGGVTTRFDSRKCQIEYEKDCCRRNGYRFEK